MTTANVKDIARELSLSPGTVSKAMRASCRLVSVDTAYQVLSYCAKKAYMSRLEAGKTLLKIKSQAASPSSQIFTLLYRTGVPAYDEVFAGVCEYLQANELFTSCFMVSDPSCIKNFPIDRAVAAILIGRIPRKIHDELHLREVPVVLADDRVIGSPASAVNSNNLEAVSNAVHILAELGHQQIAFFCRHEDKPDTTYTFHQRQIGYLSGMASHGFSVEERLLVLDYAHNNSPVLAWDESVIDGITRLAERFLVIKPMPTAVICANDLMACILMDTLKKHGVCVPEEVSVIGYDGWNRLTPVSNLGFSGASTMAVDWREIGREAAELVITMQFSELQSPRYVEVPCEYVDYGTVAPPKYY